MLFECKYMKISLVDKAHLKSGQIIWEWGQLYRDAVGST